MSESDRQRVRERESRATCKHSMSAAFAVVFVMIMRVYQKLDERV